MTTMRVLGLKVYLAVLLAMAGALVLAGPALAHPHEAEPAHDGAGQQRGNGRDDGPRDARGGARGWFLRPPPNKTGPRPPAARHESGQQRRMIGCGCLLNEKPLPISCPQILCAQTERIHNHCVWMNSFPLTAPGSEMNQRP